MDKKKVLIISMTGGFGHIRAGQSLFDYAQKNLPDISVEHIDIANLNFFLKKITIRFYDVASKKLPFIWGFLYALSNVSYIAVVFKKIAKMHYGYARSIEKYVYQKNPDAIIFTNVLPLSLLSRGFQGKMSGVTMGVVVTDYHGHTYYSFPWVDYYFVPTLDVQEELQRAGVSKEKIVISGIPINPRFYVQENIGELKLKYGIKNTLPIILLIASFAISKKELAAAVGQLLEFQPEINVIVIASGNQEFYGMIKNTFSGNERFLVVNWTNAMEEYIKISDVVISKAGGLTVSECLTLKKPIIIVNPILGQEEYNAAFVEKNNFGIRIKKINDIFTYLPSMIEFSKKNQMPLLSQENPCKKIFQYMLK